MIYLVTLKVKGYISISIGISICQLQKLVFKAIKRNRNTLCQRFRHRAITSSYFDIYSIKEHGHCNIALLLGFITDATIACPTLIWCQCIKVNVRQNKSYLQATKYSMKQKPVILLLVKLLPCKWYVKIESFNDCEHFSYSGNPHILMNGSVNIKLVIWNGLCAY